MKDGSKEFVLNSEQDFPQVKDLTEFNEKPPGR
jgi:hypothetical protein